MKWCVRCKEYWDGNFCWKCGIEMVDYHDECENCKKKVGKLDYFCPNCGFKTMRIKK